MKVLSFIILYSILVSKAYSYPTFIGYGYTSCQVCHFNAFGGGPLTDYGRALGATAIAAPGPFSKGATEEDLALASGFLGRKPLPQWFRPAFDFRGLMFVDEVQVEDPSRRFIPMQLDAALTIQSSSYKHWATASVGYLPSRPSKGSSSAGRAPLISREHYVSTQVAETTRVMVGMMDIPFGIRIPDHTAYSRSAAQLRQNDQTHQVAIHHYGEFYELGISGIAGNFFQKSELRQKGGSITAEYDLYEKVRLGHSHLYTSNDYRTRWMNALHAKVGAGQGSAALFEVGVVKETTEIPTSTLASYFLVENMLRIDRGLHLLILGEYYTQDTFQSSPRSIRIGPGVQYFPMNRLELRGDFQMTRTLNAQSVEKDSLDLLLQAHMWF